MKKRPKGMRDMIGIEAEIAREAREEGVQLGREEGRQEGRQEGEKLGEQRGVFATLASLVQDKILTPADAAKRANMTEDEFMQQLCAISNA